jgi:hypothetical protein
MKTWQASAGGADRLADLAGALALCRLLGQAACEGECVLAEVDVPASGHSIGQPQEILGQAAPECPGVVEMRVEQLVQLGINGVARTLYRPMEPDLGCRVTLPV